MILNPCTMTGELEDENVCKICKYTQCTYAGRPTCAERVAQYEKEDAEKKNAK